MSRRYFTTIVAILWLCVTFSALRAQTHPSLFFDRAGMDALRDRALNNPRFNKIWLEYKKERSDPALKVTVAPGSIPDQDTGRDYGNAVADLSIAYVVTRDKRYADKAIEIALELCKKNNWSLQLAVAHISIGIAFMWDVLYDQLDGTERKQIRSGVRNNANNHINSNQQSNHNWTPSGAEGLIGLAFKDESGSLGSFARGLVDDTKENFKEGPKSVLWAHGTDGFSPQGLGYWRKYNHMALFFHALRFNEPANDWYHLGKEYPGSEFLKNNAYPRIYGDVLHKDLSCLTWNDSKQVADDSEGPFGGMGLLSLAASEYKDGYALSFMDYLINESGFRLEPEDFGVMIFYDDTGVPSQDFRTLPLSGYWPNMEGAIFRSGWDKNDIIFYMRCGSPLGHSRKIKGLRPDKHSHPDANGFVLFYNNDYLAAEDGAQPQFGPYQKKPITYGHNTILVDGKGQRGDKTPTLSATTANMDFLDADHVGYLLGDASDAYNQMDHFFRYVVYKKHKYFIIVDELKDTRSHKYEFLLGTDPHHSITSGSNNKFTIKPNKGNAKLPVVFVEPQNLSSSIKTEREYAIVTTSVDLLRVWPGRKSSSATFFALLYPRKKNESDPSYTKIYDGDRSGILVDGNEYHLYNKNGERYTYGQIDTDAKLVYFKDDPNAFEYLAAGSKDLLYNGAKGFTSDKPLVAAFEGTSGQIRLGKNLGVSAQTKITLFYPGITGVLVDGQNQSLLSSGSGSVTFKLSPKTYKIGPTGDEQTVTDNYDVEILTGPFTPFVTVSRPNGGESFVVASSEAIQWSSGGSFANVEIEYSSNGGANWQTVISSTSNDGKYDWTVPNSVTSNALVRISDAADGTPSDVSDAVFTILTAPPPLPQAPVITSFNPGSGSVGTVVTISGQHFTGANKVEFNGVAAIFSVTSDSEISATVPAGATTGKISVSTSAGTALSAADYLVGSGGGTGSATFLAEEDTYVRSSKAGQKNGSATSLRVRKTRSSDYRAYFKFQVAGVTGIKSAKLRLFVNDGSKIGGDVYVVSNFYQGSATLWDEDGLNWKNAPPVTGAPLSSLGAVSTSETVEFDVSQAISGNGRFSFAVTTPSSDQVKYASKENGNPPELVVFTDPGPQPVPSLSTFLPDSGTVGTQVTIQGQNLTTTSQVTFGGVDASFSVQSDSRVLATVPGGAVTGKIRLTTAGGTAESANSFTVVVPPPQPPSISSFSPTSGTVGTVVDILGSDFTGTTEVVFNGEPATFSVKSDSEIQATVPDSAKTGRITVVNFVGADTSDVDFDVTTGGGQTTETKRFFPTDDTFAWAKKPNDNYGGNDFMRIRKASKQQIAFLKFDVQGLNGSVVDAKLRLLCTDGSNDGGGVHSVTTNWIENSLNWNNAPTVSGPALASVAAVAAGETIEFDVTASVTSDGVYGFAIKNRSSNVVIYSSKEGGPAPELEITTSGGSLGVAARSTRNPIEAFAPTGARFQKPSEISLAPNYPNPFNLETTFHFGIPEAADVRLVIYNMRGQEVRTLISGLQAAGFQSVRWNGRDDLGEEVSSGVYIVRMRVGAQVRNGKLILLK